LQETSVTLYLFCLFGQTALTAAVGVAVVYFTTWERDPVPLAIGLGIVAYAVAVAFYTLLGTWRLRRLGLRNYCPPEGKPSPDPAAAPPPKNGQLLPLCQREPPQP